MCSGFFDYSVSCKFYFKLGLLESIDILSVQRLEQLFSKVSVQLLYMYIYKAAHTTKSFLVHVLCLLCLSTMYPKKFNETTGE